MNISATSPLDWPAGVPRTMIPTVSQFVTEPTRARMHLVSEMRRLGSKKVRISSNARADRYGSFLERQPRIEDHGVAVYFDVGGLERCIASDKYVVWWDNLHAVGLMIQAIRGIERWGGRQVVLAALEGFKALPVPAPVQPDPDWWEVLGVSPSADPVVIEAAYKALAKRTHPDLGGDAARFRAINRAYELARVR